MNSGRYVLVVDDDDAILETIREVLEDDGYEVRTLKDGSALMGTVHSSLPGLILLDLRMPRIDGRQLFARLQSDPVAAAVPVVIITADGHGADQANTLGANAYLAKPFDIDALFRCVEQYVGPPPVA